MKVVLEIHLGFAFFVLLIALFLGWVQLGRRTLTAIIGIQVLIGIVAAAVAGASHLPLPATLWVHIVAALLAMFAYIAARRVGERSVPGALVLSFAGLALIVFTIWYGSRLVFTHGF